MTERDRTVTTVLVAAEHLDLGGIGIEGDEYRHLFRARRLEIGDAVRLTDGHGRTRSGRVVEIDKSSARIATEGSIAELPRPATRLIVPVLKPQRTAWMVEKATELGVAEIRFYSGPRAPRTLTPAARGRLQRIAAAALAQSHGVWLPHVIPPVPLASVIDVLPRDLNRYVCHIGGEACADPGSSVAWAIGAEGGWTDSEADLLRTSGFVPARLAASTLRAETAAIAAAAHSAFSAAGD